MRSALEILKYDGSVTPTYKACIFIMISDNLRLFNDNDGSINPLNNLVGYSPVKDIYIYQCALNLFVNNLPKTYVYHKTSSQQAGSYLHHFYTPPLI